MSVPVMMGIASPTGSHIPSLTAAIESAPSGSLVIEHGVGMYSTPLLCRYPIRVLCAEAHAGWLEWARWMYSHAGTAHEFVPSFKALVPRMSECSVIFIDGDAKERGPLLRSALEHRVSTIVAHDTEERCWSHYGFQQHYFEYRGYAIDHFSEDTHRTTVWRRQS